jgi:hypothetical protein
MGKLLSTAMFKRLEVIKKERHSTTAAFGYASTFELFDTFGF